MHTPQELLQLFEDYRAKHPFSATPDELYEPIRYILNLGGKRMRPVLVLMGCDLFDRNCEDALPCAYAMELFHNFTLAHDDIMDNAALRRGSATLHEKFSTAQAILSGDVMMIYAYRFLGRMEAAKRGSALELFNTTAIRVCEGQQYDMNFQTRTEVAVNEYLKMIEYKTAELVACSLKAGAIAAGAPPRDADRLYDFGKNIGICFQLMDDLLDAFGEEGKFGKKIGGDIIQNKKTYLHIKAMELAGKDIRDQLTFYFSNNMPVEEKVSAVLKIYRTLGVEALAREEAQNFHRSAFKNLDEVDAPAERKRPLREFAEAMLARQI